MEKQNIQNLRINEDAFLKLSKRKKILEQGTGHFTGFPSIDMPWLKYYTEEQIMAPIPHMTAYDFLRFSNMNNLKNVALEYFDKKITYKDLFKNISATSKALINAGVKPGDVVTILLPACPEEEYLFYAIDQIGACANFIFPGTPLSEVEKNMELFKSNKLIVLDDILQQPNTIVGNERYEIISTTLTGEYNVKANNIKGWQSFIEEGQDTIIPNYKRDENEPLFVAKTGGSTGKPKNIMLSDKCFNIQAQQHLNSPINYNMGDRWVRLWPLFSAAIAVTSMHLPLCYGMTVVIEPALDINKLDEIIINYKPSHLVVISSCMDSLLKSEKIQGMDLSFIKTLGVGGEAVTAEYEEKALQFMLEHNIVPNMTYGYGMTENASGATSRFNDATSSVGGVGIPQVNTIVSIFDPETEEELKYYEEGEICVLSSTHMLGYYNEPEKTKAVLRKHKDGRVWLHSQDLGYMDENGQLFVKGRLKRVIFLFTGHKVYPLDIEELIESIDEIDKAIVVPEPDPIHENSLVPCVFLTLNKAITETELRRKIDEIVGQNSESFVKINSIHIKQELPKTDVGKVDLKTLEQEAFVLRKRNN